MFTAAELCSSWHEIISCVIHFRSSNTKPFSTTSTRCRPSPDTGSVSHDVIYSDVKWNLWNFWLSLHHSSTLLGVPSFAMFWRWGFEEFPQLVGRYCSYIVPKQAGGNSPNSYLQNLANDGMPNSVVNFDSIFGFCLSNPTGICVTFSYSRSVGGRGMTHEH